MALPKAALLIVTCVLSLNGVTSYEVHTLEPCYSDHTVWLGKNDKSALNFSLGNFKIEPQLKDQPYKCSFRIQASRNERIVAVIQRMNLRENGFTCLDYVEFSEIPTLLVTKLYDSLHNQKKQVCGSKNVSIMTLPTDIVLHAFDKYTLPQNVYISKQREMKVKVSISRTPLRRDETLDLQIIFTAAKIGSECKDRSDFDCGNKTCIWKGFYKDGFMNCPYAGCPDEDGCEAGPIVKYSSGSGTTIIICAVVSMLSVLGVFLVCLFICRRCKVLCWAHRPPSARDPAARVSSHPSEAAQPSAPPLISLHDKDLPPSYDSLFPARITDEGVSLVKDDGFERCRRSRNVSRDAFQVCKHSRNVSDDGTERCRRPRYVSDDGTEGCRRPRNMSDDGTERCTRLKNVSDDGVERCRRPRNVSDDAVERYMRSRNVSDDGLERCRRPKNVSSHKPLGVRMEGGAMRYCRRNLELELTRNESRREAALSRSANRRHPYSRPRHLEQYRGRCIKNHRPIHLSQEQNSETVHGR